MAIWQNLLLLAIAFPAFVASQAGRGQPMGPLDAVAAALFTTFLCIETTADNQQYAFQSRARAVAACGPAACAGLLPPRRSHRAQVVSMTSPTELARPAAEKYRRIAAKEPLSGMYKDGFNSGGLFAFSRHPNFFSEQASPGTHACRGAWSRRRSRLAMQSPCRCCTLLAGLHV